MIEQPLHRRPDGELIEALRGLEPVLDWPSATPPAGGPDIAAAVRARIETLSPATGPDVNGPRPGPWWQAREWVWRPARRATLIAILALIALAAIVAAAGFGLPGLRLFFGEGPASPPPSLAPTPSLAPSRSPASVAPGARMFLGEPISPSDRAALDARAGFAVVWPADALVGPPAAAYIDQAKRGQVSLVWASQPDLPATLEPGVGLVMTEFRGFVDSSFFGKVVGLDTTVESVLVGGHPGFWLSGAPHFFFYSGPSGVVQDGRRWVGDALLWSNGPITYRIESALGRGATIAIAESLR